MNPVESIREYCQQYLSKERYEHLVRVHETMRELNEQKALRLPTEQLALAAFGHDIARELPGEVSQLLAVHSGLPIEPWELEYKLFCHNKAGIYILQSCFGVEDSAVFQAIAHHTLGNSGLCTLAQLLYIADFLEPKRPYLREGERQMYMAMAMPEIVHHVCRRTVEFLEKHGKPILPPTAAMLAELESPNKLQKIQEEL